MSWELFLIWDFCLSQGYHNPNPRQPPHILSFMSQRASTLLFYQPAASTFICDNTVCAPRDTTAGHFVGDEASVRAPHAVLQSFMLSSLRSEPVSSDSTGVSTACDTVHQPNRTLDLNLQLRVRHHGCHPLHTSALLPPYPDYDLLLDLAEPALLLPHMVNTRPLTSSATG